MPKACMVTTYRSIGNPEALAAYAKLAGPAIQAAGGRFLVRGNAEKAYEAGLKLRTVVVEFASLAQAIAACEGPGYAQALRVLGKGAAERDIHIVEGVDGSGSDADRAATGWTPSAVSSDVDHHGRDGQRPAQAPSGSCHAG